MSSKISPSESGIAPGITRKIQWFRPVQRTLSLDRSFGHLLNIASLFAVYAGISLGIVACVSSNAGTSGKLPRTDRSDGDSGKKVTDIVPGLPLASPSGSIPGPAPALASKLDVEAEDRLIAGPVSARMIRLNRHLESLEGDLILGNSDIQVVMEGVGYTSASAGWHPLVKAMFLPTEDGNWRQVRDLWQQGVIEFALSEKEGIGAVTATSIATMDSSVDRSQGIARLVLGVSSGTPAAATNLVVSLRKNSALVEIAMKKSPLLLRVSSMQRRWIPGPWSATGQPDSKLRNRQTAPYFFTAPRYVDERQPDPPFIIAGKTGVQYLEQRRFLVIGSLGDRSTNRPAGEWTSFLIAVGSDATSMFPAVFSSYNACSKSDGSQTTPISCFELINATGFAAGIAAPPVYPVGWSLVTPSGETAMEGIWSAKDQTLFNMPPQLSLNGWNLFVERDETRSIPLEGAAVAPSRLGSIRASIAFPESPLRAVVFSIENARGKARPTALVIERQEPAGDLVLKAPGTATKTQGSNAAVLHAGTLIVKRWPFKMELPVGRYAVSFVIGQAGEICRSSFELKPAIPSDQRVVCQMGTEFMKRRSPDHSFLDPMPAPVGLSEIDRKSWRLIGWTDFYNDDLIQSAKVDANTGWSVFALSARSTKTDNPPISESVGDRSADNRSPASLDTLRFIAGTLRNDHPGSLIVLGCPRFDATEKSLREAIALTNPDAVSVVGCSSAVHGHETLTDTTILKVLDSSAGQRDGTPPALFPSLEGPGQLNPSLAIQFSGVIKDFGPEELLSKLKGRKFGIAAGARLYVVDISVDEPSQQMNIVTKFESDVGVEARRFFVTSPGGASVTKTISGSEREVVIQMSLKTIAKKKSILKQIRIDLMGKPAASLAPSQELAGAGQSGEGVLATTNFFEVEPFLSKSANQRSPRL